MQKGERSRSHWGKQRRQLNWSRCRLKGRLMWDNRSMCMLSPPGKYCDTICCFFVSYSECITIKSDYYFCVLVIQLQRSRTQPRYPSATQWTMRTIVSTWVVRCWDGVKRDGFVRQGIQRCRSSLMRTLTTCFNSSLLLKPTRSYTTDQSGLMLTLVTLMSLLDGIGSTDNRQVL